MSDEIKLEKKLSGLNVWSLAFGCIIGWGAFVMPGNTFLVKAGPMGTVIAMMIAIIVMIIIAFNYHFMILKFPVAGGEFSYTREAFGRKNAYICSWFLSLSYLAIVPLNATALALIGRNLMENIFQIGFHYVVAGYDVYMGEIMLAIVALTLFAFLSIRGVRVIGVIQNGLAIALIAGVLVIAIAACISPMASWENLMPLYYPSESYIPGVLAVVAVAPWAFVGFDTIPQAAEEFNFSPRKTRVIMIISIVFGGLIYIILNTVTASVIPDGYASWVEYIDDIKNLNGLISLPTFYVAEQLLGKAGVIFLGMSVLAAILSGIVGFYMATSRLLYSMAKAEVLPSLFAKLHPKYKTPQNAIIFIFLISILAPFLGRTALGWIVDMSSIGAAIGYGYTSAAALKFAIKEREYFIMITGAIGVVISIGFAILLLVPIPMFSCSLGLESYICLLIWILLGVVFYCISKKQRM